MNAGEQYAQRQQGLPPELTALVREIYQVLGPYLAPRINSWTEFEDRFLGDQRPDASVALWCKITEAFLLYRGRYLAGKKVQYDFGRQLVGSLLQIANGGGTVQTTQLRCPPKIGQRLLRCFTDVHLTQENPHGPREESPQGEAVPVSDVG